MPINVLAGKVAIVTGGAQGIGRAIALRFAKEGAAITIADVQVDKAKKVAEEITRAGGKAIVTNTDVTSKAQVQEMVKKTIDTFGGLHILVNDAGITRRGSFVEMSEKDFDDVMAVNVKGVFLCTQAVLPHMMKQRYGKIVNLASIAGQGMPGIPGSGSCCYSTSKAAVQQLTAIAANEMGEYNINVNAIAPAGTRGAMMRHQRTPEAADAFELVAAKRAVLGRLGEPEDQANLVTFLVSEEASFITASTIRCDGGRPGAG